MPALFKPQESLRAYGDNVWLYRSVLSIAMELASVDFKIRKPLKSGEFEYVLKHQALDTLKTPQPTAGGKSMLTGMLLKIVTGMHLMLTRAVRTTTEVLEVGRLIVAEGTDRLQYRPAVGEGLRGAPDPAGGLRPVAVGRPGRMWVRSRLIKGENAGFRAVMLRGEIVPFGELAFSAANALGAATSTSELTGPRRIGHSAMAESLSNKSGS